MKLMVRSMIALWVIAGSLLVLNFVVDWDSIEQQQVETRVEELLDVQHEVLGLLARGRKEKAALHLTNSPYQYRIFVNGEMTNWSDNKSLPPYSLLRNEDSVYFLNHISGNYIVQRESFQEDGDIIELFSLLNLRKDFQIRNRFLRSIVNETVFKRIPQDISSLASLTIHYKGRDLFKIDPSGRNQQVLVSVSIWIWLFSLPLAIGVLLRTAKNRWPGSRYVLVSTVSLIGLILFLLAIGFPRTWISSLIFQRELFTSSLLGLTLGDLIMTYSVLVVIAGIISNHLPDQFEVKSGFMRMVSFAGLILGIYCNVWFFQWLLNELMMNSQIEFDITASIEFTVGRFAAFVLILLGSSIYFLINHILAKLISAVQPGGGLFLAFHLLFLVMFIELFPDLFPIFLLQFAWYWVMYLSDLSLKLKTVKLVSLEYVLSIGAMLSLIFAFSVYRYHSDTEREAKLKFASRLALEKDVLGEFYLDEILQRFRMDATIQERLNNGIFARQNIREKIRRQFVSSYFDKYELEILLFDQEGNVLDTEGFPFQYYSERFARELYKTDYNGIYLVNDSENISQRKYACFIKVSDEGYVLINLIRKRNTPTSVFPELLVESKYEQENISSYDFTIFRDSKVLYGQGTYGHVNYLEPDDLTKDDLFEDGISEENRHFIGLKTSDGRVIVIVSPSYLNRNWVINFSFLFLQYIVLISIIALVYRLILNFKTLSLANKIQLYLALGFLIPLFVTGLTLLNTLNESYKEEITKSYLKESLRISENLVEETVKYINNESDLNSFANYVGDVSGFVQADLNVYDTNGVLITTSQPGIFSLNLLSDRINPIALRALNDDSQNIIVDESIGLLDFKTTYTSISGYTDGQIYGILALPFFDSKNHLITQQREVFADLLMIFALISLFAIISGNYILNYLIGPLKIVSDHLKRTNWEEENPLLDYNRDDEIGVLVKEYNQMLVKLERNKEALARSQKESAWKEIARQVAHEIKNPLTPMRLKIQQMQRDIDDEKKVGVLESLIKQIDTMSHIADSFSEFAKMPAPENIEFDIVSVVHESVLLHIGKHIIIETDLPKTAIYVWADPKIMDRIMNNLILNAKQAVVDKMPEIKVSVWKEESKVIISCADNGSGIPERIRDKIFTTYFSTKSTGSGIGLAVAKKGIENAGGNIWFESEEGKGTTFYISLPVYEAL